MLSDEAPTEKEVLAWLAIQDNARLVLEFVGDLSAAQFAGDRKTFCAVTRCPEFISEAARRLRGAQQDRFPELE